MKKLRFVAILLAFVLSASNILSPIHVHAEESNVQVSGELTENAVEDITDKPEENMEEKENITEELPTEEDVSKEPDKEAMQESTNKQESPLQESTKPKQEIQKQEIPKQEKPMLQDPVKEEIIEIQPENNQDTSEENTEEKSEPYIRYRADGIKEIFITEEQFAEYLEYERLHHNDPVQVTDEVSITYFPNIATTSARASDLVYSGKVTYHGYDVGKFTVGGKLSFCIQHSKWNPPTGNAYTLQDWNNETAKKILYYGFQGVKPWSKFESDVHARVLTSLALSYLIEGRFPSDSYIWDTGKLSEFITYCQNQKLPNTAMSLSKSSLNAYVKNGVQTTDSVKLNADSSNSITIQVPSGVTLTKSDGSSVTGGKATISGGQSFYFTAPLTHTGSWSSGDLYGSLKTISELKKVVPNGNYQQLAQATFGISPRDKVSLNVKWLSQGKAQVLKKSANPELTNNNPCYSLAGAEYKIYTDQAAATQPIATLTTATNGYSNVVSLNAGTYYIKETKAPLGFALDPDVHTLTVNAGVTTTFEHIDLPQMDPVAILLGKIDKETNQNKPQGSASLQGAQFTVKYYAGLWDKDTDPETLGQKPVRTWVFATDEDGFCYYDERFKVSGDELFLSPTGKATLPIGTITIQETKAPEGYHINPELFVVQITPEGNDQFVSTYNQPIIPEAILQLELLKKQAGTDVVIPDTEFTHTLPNGTTEILSTDENGKLTIKGLTRGKHKLQETKVTDGYLLNGNVLEFNVAEDNKITLLSSIDDSEGKVKFEITKEGNISIVVEDKLAPFQLKVQKFNDKKKLLAGAEFTLYSERECKNELKKATTDDSGMLTMADLEVGKKYYIKETKAPEGYRIPLDLFGNPIIYEFYTESTPTKGEFIFYVDGKAYTSSSDPDGMFTVTGTRKDRIVNMKIINNIGKLLPETGSSGTTLFILFGTACVLLYFYMKQNQGMKGRISMKHMKKFFSMIFIMALLATSTFSAITVNAASIQTPGGVANFGRGNASITINGNKDQSLVGKKFNVYELFHAQNAVGGESINYTFNEAFKLPLQTVVGKKLGKPANTITEYQVIDYIQTLNTNPVEGAQAAQKVEGSYSSFRYFIEELRSEIVKQGVAGDVVTVTATTGSNSIQISGLDYGYYIVDEVSSVEGTHSAASLCIVNTANPEADVVVKSDYPSVIKKIQEDDGRNEIGNEGWNDMADFEIGQTVPYKYTSNIPNMNGYHTYYYAWHDKMDPALTFKPSSVSITIKDKTKSYTLAASEFRVIENPGNDETFKVEVQDMKAIVDREFNQMNKLKENVYNQEVTLRYDAVLNDLASQDTGMPGFENDVKLEFSNDPDATGQGKTGETPWDTVVCFTYKLNLLKTNDHALHLEGAKFRLYSDEKCTNEVYVKKEADGYHVINRDSVGGSDHTGGTAPNNAVEMVTDKNGDIVILGLDGGTYWLKETEAPAGYRKILDPIRVEIRPSFAPNRNVYVKGDGANGKALTQLEAFAYIKQFLSGVFKDENLTLTTDLANGSANINVVNTVGKKLPITGSNGMFILLGAGCVLVALGKVFSKKKKDSMN